MEDITNQILARIGSSEAPQEESSPEETNEPVETLEASAPEVSTQEPAETPAQQSWKQLREQAEEGKRTKKQLEEAYRMLQLLEQKIQQNSQQRTAPEPEDDFNIDTLPDEEYSDNKKLKQILKQQQNNYKKLQKEVENSKKSAYQATVESRIRDEYPDFKEIVSEENVARLRETKPHIFKSLSYNPDLYEQAAGAYEAIKDLGINKPVAGFDREKYQLEQNLGKPRASSTVGTTKKKSALDDVSRYNNPSSEDLKAFYEDAIKKSGRSLAYNS